MTISLNAIGMHVPDQEVRKLEFFGTYGVARDITDRKRAEEVISYQAYHDILTDLPNRILFKDRLGLAVIQAKRKQTELAVMFIDLDRFKLVNDTLGHVKGDELLSRSRAPEGMPAQGRYAGAPGRRRIHHRAARAARPRRRQRRGRQVPRMPAPALRPGRPRSAHLGLDRHRGLPGPRRIDRRAAAPRRHRHVPGQGPGQERPRLLRPSMQDVSHQKIALEQSLRRALEHGELEMYYQPQIDPIGGRIVGAEALMRWNHPTRGVVSPGEFLPFAEENGLMLPISDWMIGALCRDMLQWKSIGGGQVKLSLNLSPQYLDRGDFFEKMRGALVRYGIAPSQIEVEITENICIRNPQHAIEQLNKLGQLGVSVAIDDFGTGYSSLAYLHRFPVHTIKIDQSFVKEIHDEHGHYPVILAIISIARGLGLNLIAEGVETDVQARYLRSNGCLTMQGYLYHRPMPLGRFIGVLRSQGMPAGASGMMAFQA
jgi:EAL domain-containing protein (putative c-di-GMP-specific phosphodiesterase class I)